jgi:hypothetical protein
LKKPPDQNATLLLMCLHKIAVFFAISPTNKKTQNHFQRIFCFVLITLLRPKVDDKLSTFILC